MLPPPLECSSPNARPLGDQPALLQRINSTIELMREGFVSVVHLWIDSAGGGDRGVTLRYTLLNHITDNSFTHTTHVYMRVFAFQPSIGPINL